jgi:hypothetical protein
MSEVLIHNVESNEIIVRDMTEKELIQKEKDVLDVQSELQEIQNANNKKKALLEKLGITEDEARLLLG